ncbi:MAG TPA: hypothetical protein VFL30_07640 [Rhodanobacteraceae bacterium]|nr:hypothetical protein [Rhodanobacteraceae bacterium]
MNAKLAAIAVAVAVFGYLIWHKHAENVEAAALADLTDENGFVALAQPVGIKPDKVFIFAPANCPREAGQRSDALTQSLVDRGVAYSRSAHLSYEPMDPVMLGRVNAMLAGDNAPIVFVNGRIKANPALDEVLAEYEAAQR